MTDRRQLAAPPEEQKIALLTKAKAAAVAGVDWIQLREKDLPAAELSELARKSVSNMLGSCRLLINDRLDVACAAQAGGVHLGEQSISVREARRFAQERGVRRNFLIGASVHSLEAAKTAEGEGASYMIFGPVFATPSKAKYGSALGLEELASVCRSVSIPVLAIGGITLENASECLMQGANGIAAIRVFQESQDLAALAKRLRGAW